ncbi:MAG: C4-type zinc ribbon domain-containing protein [Lentisphaeraceae bacterium]|nr:C4-type zinc ribbon domain-containing protein [Lentisphaeraceae bacterium]
MGPLSKLLKIQELELVLKESAIVHSDKDIETDELQKQIDTLKSDVPERLMKHFDRVKKNGLGITQELDGRCKACHMSIPVGNLSRINNGSDEPKCPTCQVFIFTSSFTEEN